MKKFISIFTFMFFLSLPAFAENDKKYSSIREEIPNSVGIGVGVMPFLDIYYDRAINKNISLGINYSNSIQNNISGHLRYYFFNKEYYNSDFYTESRLGFGIGPGETGEKVGFGFFIGGNTFNAMQLFGYESRNKNGFIFNIAGGTGLYISPNLAGAIAIAGTLSFGYAF